MLYKDLEEPIRLSQLNDLLDIVKQMLTGKLKFLLVVLNFQ